MTRLTSRTARSFGHVSALAGVLACLLCLLLCAVPSGLAQAEQQNPTLTVHATVSGEQSPSTGMASLLPTGAHTAGAGYVFRLDRLDPAKISSAIPAADTREQRSERILSDPSAFMAAGAGPIFGVTDENGTVTTDSSAVAGQSGVWLSDASLDSSAGTLTGGRAMVFDGTEQSPSYWIIRLVKAPKGAGGFEPGVVQLPYEGENGFVWNVVIYPKVSEPSTTPPTTVVKPKPHPHQPLASTGSVVTMALIVLAVLLLISALLTAVDRLREHRYARQQETGGTMRAPGNQATWNQTNKTYEKTTEEANDRNDRSGCDDERKEQR